MARKICVAIAVVAAACMSTMVPRQGLAESREPVAQVWQTLRSFETQALRNYEFHLVVTGGASELGDQLWMLARSPEFQARRDSCGTAAETLSYMADGYYRSGLLREVPESWHFFAKRYLDRRRACLAELQLKEDDYPLPRWFAR